MKKTIKLLQKLLRGCSKKRNKEQGLNQLKNKLLRN